MVLQHCADRLLTSMCWLLLLAGDAVRQCRGDSAVNEALLRVRRLLRSELQAVVSLSESLQGQDGSFSSLQAVQLLQQEQLLPGAAPASNVGHTFPGSSCCLH